MCSCIQETIIDKEIIFLKFSKYSEKQIVYSMGCLEQNKAVAFATHNLFLFSSLIVA